MKAFIAQYRLTGLPGLGGTSYARTHTATAAWMARSGSLLAFGGDSTNRGALLISVAACVGQSRRSLCWDILNPGVTIWNCNPGGGCHDHAVARSAEATIISIDQQRRS
jgi:hypothetical protein